MEAVGERLVRGVWWPSTVRSALSDERAGASFGDAGSERGGRRLPPSASVMLKIPERPRRARDSPSRGLDSSSSTIPSGVPCLVGASSFSSSSTWSAVDGNPWLSLTSRTIASPIASSSASLSSSSAMLSSHPASSTFASAFFCSSDPASCVTGKLPTCVWIHPSA
jgi:hypothetical protein